jgi:putative membrane protein
MQAMINIRNVRTAAILLVLFYMVGITGMAVPETFPLFRRLIPLALLFSVAVLSFFDSAGRDMKRVVVFAMIFLTGFLVEVAGVDTGVIFGAYHYGEGLGFKIAGTPVIIGLNWLFLVYTTSGIAESLKIKKLPAVVASSATMLLYDIILEQVAAPLDMWYWSNGNAPVRNYLAWFFIALVFQTVVKFSGVKTTNRISPVVFVCQFMFLVAMLLIFKSVA